MSYGNGSVVFVVPALEIDATWDPARRAPFIGCWAMASKLKELGYDIHYIDESFRGNAWSKRQLSVRQLDGPKMTETPLDATWDDFQAAKMADFWKLTPQKFVAKHSAFQEDGTIQRTACRIGHSDEETLYHLETLKPQAVCIPLVASANYLPATSLGRKIKQRWPEVRVMLGGQHITADPAAFLAENEWVDYIADGDAIQNIEEMVTGRYMGSKIVPGGFLTMDHYPVLDYSIIKDAGYPSTPTHNYPSGLKTVEWMSSRGCYRDCAFCFAGRRDQRPTMTEWERVTKQLDHFVEQGIEEIIFQDDAWLWKGKERIPILFGLMKERGLSFSNNGGVEFESFDRWIADLIVGYNDGRPGYCTSLYIPFNPRGWNARSTTVDAMLAHYDRIENLKLVRSSGTYVFTSQMVALPEQTLRNYHADLRSLRRLIQCGYLDAALPLMATVFKGIEWWRRFSHYIVNKLDYLAYSLFTGQIWTPHMSPRQTEICVVNTIKKLADVQQTGPWQTAFPSSTR